MDLLPPSLMCSVHLHYTLTKPPQRWESLLNHKDQLCFLSSDTNNGTFLKIAFGEFPGGLVVRILGFHCHGLGSIPGQGTEIPQATWCGQKKRKKKKIAFVPNSVRGHGDLLLALYVLTWTMYLWWIVYKISVCHCHVWSFVSKMYMTVPSTSNRQEVLRAFQDSVSQVIILFGSNKIPFFLLNLIVNWTFGNKSNKICTRST